MCLCFPNFAQVFPEDLPFCEALGGPPQQPPPSFEGYHQRNDGPDFLSAVKDVLDAAAATQEPEPTAESTGLLTEAQNKEGKG